MLENSLELTDPPSDTDDHSSPESDQEYLDEHLKRLPPCITSLESFTKILKPQCVSDSQFFMITLPLVRSLVVADFECSMVGVSGTRFRRAPEMLRQLKNRESPLQITMKCDVYSFPMLDYELVTGSIPFEDHASSDYNVVVSGGRPKLPIDLDSSVKDIITECWRLEPSKRPDFIPFEKRLGVLLHQRECEGWVNAKYRDLGAVHTMTIRSTCPWTNSPSFRHALRKDKEEVY